MGLRKLFVLVLFAAAIWGCSKPNAGSDANPNAAAAPIPMPTPIPLPTPTPTPVPTTTPTITPTVATRAPVYQFYDNWSGQYFYSVSSTEGTNYGWESQGPAFLVYTSQTAGTAAIYRCFDGYQHYISAAACADAAEGVYGYIGASQLAGTVPLYRMLDKWGNYYVTTNQAGAVGVGFYPDITLGYVPTN